MLTKLRECHLYWCHEHAYLRGRLIMLLLVYQCKQYLHMYTFLELQKSTFIWINLGLSICVKIYNDNSNYNIKNIFLVLKVVCCEQ